MFEGFATRPGVPTRVYEDFLIFSPKFWRFWFFWRFFDFYFLSHVKFEKIFWDFLWFFDFFVIFWDFLWFFFVIFWGAYEDFFELRTPRSMVQTWKYLKAILVRIQEVNWCDRKRVLSCFSIELGALRIWGRLNYHLTTK